MQVWVVYESKLGNTFKLARAMAEALAGKHLVRLIPVEEAETPYAVDLLIIGCPQHRHHPPEVTLAWPFKLPPGALRSMKMAVFDIRYKRRVFWQRDGAAQMVAKRLKSMGGVLIVKPKSFYLEYRGQPITENEIIKGVAWVQEIAEKINPHTPPLTNIPPGKKVVVTPHRSEWNN